MQFFVRFLSLFHLKMKLNDLNLINHFFNWNEIANVKLNYQQFVFIHFLPALAWSLNLKRKINSLRKACNFVHYSTPNDFLIIHYYLNFSKCMQFFIVVSLENEVNAVNYCEISWISCLDWVIITSICLCLLYGSICHYLVNFLMTCAVFHVQMK